MALTAKQEAFAQHYARHRSGAAAYLSAYNARNSGPGTVATEVHRMLTHPAISLRISQLQEVVCATAPVIMEAAEAVALDVTVLTADPTELSRVHIGCCRRCWGTDHKEQWKDYEYLEAVERAQATAAATRKPPELPDIAGGLGYWHDREPNPACPACCGNGEPHTYFADTRTLSEAGKKLFVAVKQTNRGLEIITRSKDAAADRVGRALGLFKDSLNLTAKVATKDFSTITDPAEAERAYRLFAALTDE